MSIGGALTLFILGATLRFVLKEPIHGIDLHIAGVILMLAGVIIVVLSLVRPGSGLPTLRRPAIRRRRPPGNPPPPASDEQRPRAGQG
jgi:hypothetical protein